LRPERYQEEIDRLAGKYKPSSVRCWVKGLRAFFNFLLKMKYLKVNPVQDLILPKLTHSLPKALDYDRVIDILDKAGKLTGFEGKRDRAILELGYATMAIRSDWANALLSDLNLEKMPFRVVSKGGNEDLLIFGEKARDALLEYLEERKIVARPDIDYLFIDKKGEKLKSIYNCVKRLAGCGPHAFMRHSPATHMMEKGADILVASTLMRHKSIETTRIYAKIANDKLRRQFERFHPRG
jgi:site-specific recombinase XerD